MILFHVFNSEKWQNAADFKQKPQSKPMLCVACYRFTLRLCPLQGMVGIAHVEFSDIINKNVKNCFGQKNKEPALYCK